MHDHEVSAAAVTTKQNTTKVKPTHIDKPSTMSTTGAALGKPSLKLLLAQ